MTEKEAREKLEKKLAEESKDPESIHYFAVVSDRYYLGMWCLPLPEPLCKYGAKDGDVVMLAHRKLDTLTEWTIKWRFRYHLGPNPEDPYSVHDRKDWFMGQITGQSEAEVQARIEKLMDLIVIGGNVVAGGLVSPGQPDFLELRCTGDQFLAKAQAAHKDWMHVGEPEKLEKEQYYSRREQASREADLAREVEKTRPGVG